MTWPRLLLALAVGGALACANPYLTRRHTHLSYEKAAERHVAVSVFVTDAPRDEVRITPVSLSDRGQGALVEALEAKSESSEALLRALGSKLGGTPSPGLIIDRTRFHRRLVLSAERSGRWKHRPSDRIHYLRFEISGLENGTFRSWNRFTTEYAEVDLGKVTLAQSVTGSVSAAVGPAAGSAVPASGAAAVSASRNLTEEVSLRQRRVALTGILQEKGAELIQKGVVGIDLAGNAAVDVEVAATPKPSLQSVAFIPALRGAGGWLAQDEIDIGWAYLRIPEHAEPITFDYLSEYAVRHVRWRGRSILEGDDWAKLVSGKTPPHCGLELVGKDELKVRAWHIENNDGEALEIDTGTLRFGSFEEARDLLNWLRKEGAKNEGIVRIGNHDLETVSGPVEADDVERMAISVMDLN